MFLSALTLAGLLLQGQQPDGPIRVDTLLTRDGSQARLFIERNETPMLQPKKGPKRFGENKVQFEFEWLTRGTVIVHTNGQHDLRMRVYSQERKPENDAAHAVTRMMLRLWDMNYRRVHLDQPPNSLGYQILNVFITWGGKAGGEQFFGPDFEGKTRVTANTIYFYDLASFTDPLEMAREVAHEYGHATLPPIGGYKEREDWANGYLGEKLYLTWIRDVLAQGLLLPEDFMGVKKEQLDPWIAANVDPLVLKTAEKPPTMGTLADRTAKGMDAYLGLALYAAQILPENVFARSLKLTGSQNARDYPGAIFLALEEPDEVPITIPDILKGKAIWLPTGKGFVTGAKVLAIENGWTKVQTGSDPIVIRTKRV
ncbi:MAG: hypothetical protein ACAH95_13615 [Fimbriimonas sp.]